MAKPKFDLVHATENQINEVKSEVAELEKLLKEVGKESHIGTKIADPENLMREVIKKKKFLNDFAPKKLKGKAASKANAEAKELRKTIQDAMPPNSLYFQRDVRDDDTHNKVATFEQAVRWQMKFQTDPTLMKAVNRYKYLMRRLDPDDPTVANIEMLRSKR